MKLNKTKSFVISLTSLFMLTSCGFASKISLNSKNCNSTSLPEHNEGQHVITFNENGGILSGDKFVIVEDGKKWSEITAERPTVNYDGVQNSGWYYYTDEQKTSTKDVTNETVFTEDKELYAKWNTYNATFKTNGGYFKGTTDKEKTLNKKVKVHSTDVAIPEKAGCVFDGWYTQSEGGDKVSFPITLAANETYYAHYSPAAVNIKLAVYTGQDGHFSSGLTDRYKMIDVPTNKTWAEIKQDSSITEPVSEKDLAFDAWKYNGASISDEQTFSSSSIIKANYTAAIEITFDANGGQFPDSQTSKKSGKIKLGSTAPNFSVFEEAAYGTNKPTHDSKELLGWFTDIHAVSDKVEEDQPVTFTSSITLHACYKDEYTATFDKSEEAYKGYSVTEGNLNYIRKETKVFHITPDSTSGYKLDINEGNYSVTYDKTIYTDTTVNYEATAESGTLTITNCPGENITIKIKTVKSEYQIKATDTSEVTFTVNPSTRLAKTGDSVKVTATCTSDDFVLDSITATDAQGTVATKAKTDVWGDNSIELSFTMRTSDVTISAVSKSNYHTVTFDLKGGTGTIEPQSIKHNTYATKPSDDPILVDYKFDHWVKQNETTEFNFTTTKITSDIQIDAVYNFPPVIIEVISNTYNLDPDGSSTGTYKNQLKLKATKDGVDVTSSSQTSWSTDDSNIATVDSSTGVAIVTVVGAGSTNINASYTYKDGEGTSHVYKATWKDYESASYSKFNQNTLTKEQEGEPFPLINQPMNYSNNPPTPTGVEGPLYLANCYYRYWGGAYQKYMFVKMQVIEDQWGSWPEQEQGIDVGAFQGTNITSLDTGDYERDLWQWSFMNCKNLTTVRIRSKVTNILDAGFNGCDNLTTVYCDNADIVAAPASSPSEMSNGNLFAALPSKKKTIYVPVNATLNSEYASSYTKVTSEYSQYDKYVQN